MDAILVERNYKGEYERFALTPEEFAKEFPEAVARGTWPIQEPDVATVKPMVHIWFAPCKVGDETWNTFFTDMEDGLPVPDIENGNLAYVREDMMQSLKPYLPEQKQEKAKDDTASIIADIKAQLAEEKNTTAYGEPQAWAYLQNGRSLEVTSEQEGLAPHDYFYSVRLHCTEDEFNRGVFSDAVGVIAQYFTEGHSLDEIDGAVLNMLACNERTPVAVPDLETPNLPMSVEAQKAEAANFLIHEAFADLEDYPDSMYTDDQALLDIIADVLGAFDTKQTVVLQNAASWVADEVRNGLYCDKFNCYDVINNDGPYPLDMSQLMDPALSVPEMQSLWKRMREAYELETYGFINLDGNLSQSQMVSFYEEFGGKDGLQPSEKTYAEKISKAFEALSEALDAVDRAQQLGEIPPVPSSVIGNRLVTAKSIISEVMDYMKEQEQANESVAISEAQQNNTSQTPPAADMNTSIHAWYTNTFPEDACGKDMNPNITFGELVKAMNRGYSIYSQLGESVDTLIRERVFAQASQILGVPYGVLYDKWLSPEQAPDIPTERPKPPLASKILSASSRAPGSAEKQQAPSISDVRDR